MEQSEALHRTNKGKYTYLNPQEKPKTQGAGEKKRYPKSKFQVISWVRRRKQKFSVYLTVHRKVADT